MRVLVALLFHAPGLRLFYGHRLSRQDFHRNLVAIGATAIATAATYVRYDVTGAAAAFAAGHLLWGMYLATSSSAQGRAG